MTSGACRRRGSPEDRLTGAVVGVLGCDHVNGVGPDRTPAGSVAAALCDLTAACLVNNEAAIPVDVAARHEGVHGPAWLLPLAVVAPDARARTAAALELALAAGAVSTTVEAHVVWVELAARLLAGAAPDAAVLAATGNPLDASPGPLRPVGETAADAVSAAVRALAVDRDHRYSTAGYSVVLVDEVRRVAPPGVVTAVAALLGLCAGADTWPLAWHDQARRQLGTDLAAMLLLARDRVELTW